MVRYIRVGKLFYTYITLTLIGIFENILRVHQYNCGLIDYLTVFIFSKFEGNSKKSSTGVPKFLLALLVVSLYYDLIKPI